MGSTAFYKWYIWNGGNLFCPWQKRAKTHVFLLIKAHILHNETKANYNHEKGVILSHHWKSNYFFLMNIERVIIWSIVQKKI